MIEPNVFKAFARDVLAKARKDEVGEINADDPLSAYRREGVNKVTARPPNAGNARPPASRMTQSYGSFEEGKSAEDKTALIKELVRWGATDVPGTPRFVMRKRSPEELAALENSVGRAFRKYEAPLERGLHRATRGLPGAVKKVVRKGGKMLIRDPLTLALQPVPIPGATPAYMLGKAVVERVGNAISPKHKAMRVLAGVV